MEKIPAYKETYWHYQYQLGAQYVIPLLRSWGLEPDGMQVLDIGCAEAGVLYALCEAGAEGVGMEISPSRLFLAKHFTADVQSPLHLIAADIFHLPVKPQHPPFSLILLRDVFEHLPEKEKAFAVLAALMQEGSHLLLTFPPFYSPFGGHQQMLKSFLRRVPYFHAAPGPLWQLIRRYIEKHDANPGFLPEMQTLRENRISIARIKRLARAHNLVIAGEKYYLSRPSYKLRYGWPVLSAGLLGQIPVIRELFITGAAILLRKR